MKNLVKIRAILSVVAIAACAGCATKSRSFDASGMYVSESGQLAIGKIHVDAIPEGTDSAVIHYTEDTAWLSPSTKTHDIDIILTGTNSVGSASGIVRNICNAFVVVAPVLATPGNSTATSPIDLAAGNRAARLAEKVKKAATTTSTAADCADGSCDPCTDGSCNPSK